MMFGWLRTIIGHVQGYGGCAHCHHTWNWKKGHMIPFAAHKTRTLLDGSPYYYARMFPLCEECYQKLSPEKRLNYCKELWRKWGSPKEKVDWNIIREHVGLQSSTPKAKNE